MRHLSGLGSDPDESDDYWMPDVFKPFYRAPIEFNKLCYISDNMHVAVKMIVRLAKQSPKMGTFRASVAHIETVLVANRKILGNSKAITQVIDSMDYERVEHLCRPEVISLFTDEDMKATKLYLQLIYFIVTAYVDPTTLIEDRIFYAWYAIFFCRMWKTYTEMKGGVTLSNDFITSNANSCVELNGHNLLKFILICRELGKPEVCLVHMLSSQDNEAFFRNLRSLGSTNYTVINFTMREVLFKVRRAMTISHIEIKHNIVRRKQLKKRAEVHVPTSLPSNDRIVEIVESSYVKALHDLESVGEFLYSKHINQTYFIKRISY